MFRKAIEIDPQFARAWANISLTHAYEYTWFGRRPEHLEAALAAARRAVELDPDLAEGRAAAGFALAYGDRFEEARGHFERALEIGPASWEAHFLYGRACWAQGDMIRAAELFARATEIAPDDYQAPALAVQPLEESGQPERAVRFARVAVERARLRVERHPDDGRALYMGAIALQRLGEHERALEWARRAAETAPPEDVLDPLQPRLLLRARGRPRQSSRAARAMREPGGRISRVDRARPRLGLAARRSAVRRASHPAALTVS